MERRNARKFRERFTSVAKSAPNAGLNRIMRIGANNEPPRRDLFLFLTEIKPWLIAEQLKRYVSKREKPQRHVCLYFDPFAELNIRPKYPFHYLCVI